ncbi:uncharacterized protein LOC119768073 [Culex quinquefasciatus]|uniref:uncharacterized protein LOC119768073 n=1 Tax=Culex quinquefasciatus TaxID=7176 RepID=UPI0018E34164|nr:uncharacterized protein LOC119768073 [Culex quinquefasciatus]
MTLPTMRRLDRHMWQRQLRQLLRQCSAKTSTTPASIAYTGTIQSLANFIKSGATQPNYSRWNVCQVGHLQYGGSDNSSSTGSTTMVSAAPSAHLFKRPAIKHILILRVHGRGGLSISTNFTGPYRIRLKRITLGQPTARANVTLS